MACILLCNRRTKATARPSVDVAKVTPGTICQIHSQPGFASALQRT